MILKTIKYKSILSVSILSLFGIDVIMIDTYEDIEST